VLFKQIIVSPVMVGKGFAVNVTSDLQPLEFVYVITEVPELTAVTTPALVTVATLVVAETQGFVVAAVALPVKVKVLPTHIAELPVIVGSGFTVTVMDVLGPSHPLAVD
jgi:hypothetical protein